MSRILLADDSPHAQRMGERILREEGFEVVSLTDGENTLLRLADVDPDLILADVFLPTRSGLEICRYVKSHPKHRHARVVLTAGLLEPFDEEEAKRAGADAILKKPFEASVVMQTIHPLLAGALVDRDLFAAEAAQAEAAQAEAAQAEAAQAEAAQAEAPPPVQPVLEAPPPAPGEIDPERVRAAVTIALDAALPALIQEITERVLIALGH
jgi:CheY-like chemotaxis protein